MILIIRLLWQEIGACQYFAAAAFINIAIVIIIIFIIIILLLLFLWLLLLLLLLLILLWFILLLLLLLLLIYYYYYQSSLYAHNSLKKKRIDDNLSSGFLGLMSHEPSIISQGGQNDNFMPPRLNSDPSLYVNRLSLNGMLLFVYRNNSSKLTNYWVKNLKIFW